MHQSMDRRGFLRTTAGGSAAIALAAWLPSGCAAEYPEARQDQTRLYVLTEKEYAVTRAAAEALVVGIPVSPGVVASRIDRELSIAGEPMRTDFKTVVGLMEHLTFLGGTTRRFTKLTPAERLAYLRTWKHSRFALRRGAYFALKGFVYYFTYSDPATRAHTRFAGPWPERFKLPIKPVDFGEIA
jgi:hypothetical protein